MKLPKIFLIIIVLVGVAIILYWFFFIFSFNRICTQVIQNARNPITGEVRMFGTPCEVPLGWQKLPPSETE